MGKDDTRHMNAKLKSMNLDLLFNAVLELRDLEECSNFFEDLCTVQELKALTQRIQVAKMLVDGEVYSKIVEKTGASTATISRVNRSLVNGEDGYLTVFDKMKNNGKL
jgi:TrpR-related protein YerC/YecD